MSQIKLEILFNDQTGDVTVNGPIQNRILSYGLLDMAREIIGKTVPDKPLAGGLILARGLPNGHG